MKKLILILIIMQAFSAKSAGQVCNLGEFTFDSQNVIDSFLVQNPNCETISGDITINGTDIVSLSGLQNITEIQGSLEISFNNSLTSLEGLDNIESISGLFEIITNPALNNVQALNSLSTVGGSLRIISNPLLAALDGFEGLQLVDGSLEITNNPLIENIDAFSNLTSIDGFLTIQGNPQLISLSGLQNIVANSISFLSISQNSSLSECAYSNFCDYLGNSGANGISSNTNGCNSETEVTNACAQLSINENAIFEVKIAFLKQQNYLEIYDLDEAIRLSLYSVEGKELIQEKQLNASAFQRIFFNGPNGIYFIKIETLNGLSLSKKLIKH